MVVAAGSGGAAGFAGGTFGTVASIDAAKDTFVVKEASGTSVTVKVTKSTKFTDRAASTAGFSDVKSGVRVAVQGKTSSGTETATSVFILGAGGGFGGGPGGPGGFGGGTFGTVASIDAAKDTFVVKEASGTSVTVKVTKSTKFTNGSSSAKFSALKTGDQVAVTGTTSKGVETATAVRLGAFGRGGFGGGTFGTVASIDAAKDTFVVKEASGTSVTVKVTKSTKFTNGSSSAKFSA